ECNLPWPRCHCRVIAAGRTSAAGAVVCSKAVASGFCQLILSAGTARLLAVKQHAVGAAGNPSRSIAAAVMAVTIAANSHGVIGNGAAVVCGQQVDGGERGCAARNDVFRSGGHRSRSVISPGLFRGEEGTGRRPAWRSPFPSSIRVGKRKRQACKQSVITG